MNLLTTLSAALFALTATSAALAESSEGSSVTLETTTVGTVGKCDVEVVRSVSVCDARGECRSFQLGDELMFQVPSQGSFTVSATSAHSENGVIIGNGVSDRFQASSSSKTLVQTLEVTSRCSLSYSYDITVR